MSVFGWAVEAAAEAIRDRIAEHGYAMSLHTAHDLAGAVVEALQPAIEMVRGEAYLDGYNDGRYEDG